MKVKILESSEDNLAHFIAMKMNENLFKSGYSISLNHVMKSTEDLNNVVKRFSKIGVEILAPKYPFFSFIYQVDIVVKTPIAEKITEV